MLSPTNTRWVDPHEYTGCSVSQPTTQLSPPTTPVKRLTIVDKPLEGWRYKCMYPEEQGHRQVVFSLNMNSQTKYLDHHVQLETKQ